MSKKKRYVFIFLVHFSGELRFPVRGISTNLSFDARTLAEASTAVTENRTNQDNRSRGVVWPMELYRRVTQPSDAVKVGQAFLATVCLGFAIIFLHGFSSVACMWALACLSAGGIVGFLFGVPRVVQGAISAPVRSTKTAPVPEKPVPGPPVAPVPVEGTGSMKATATAHGVDRSETVEATWEYHQQVNTNVEQISDWLTKIIVGIGLVELRRIPDLLDSMAKRLTGPSPGENDLGFAGALIVYFSIIGYFAGYLLTRLYLAPAFGRTEQRDQNAVRGKRDELVAE